MMAVGIPSVRRSVNPAVAELLSWLKHVVLVNGQHFGAGYHNRPFLSANSLKKKLDSLLYFEH